MSIHIPEEINTYCVLIMGFADGHIALNHDLRCFDIFRGRSFIYHVPLETTIRHIKILYQLLPHLVVEKDVMVTFIENDEYFQYIYARGYWTTAQWRNRIHSIKTRGMTYRSRYEYMMSIQYIEFTKTLSYTLHRSYRRLFTGSVKICAYATNVNGDCELIYEQIVTLKDVYRFSISLPIATSGNRNESYYFEIDDAPISAPFMCFDSSIDGWIRSNLKHEIKKV